jgi:hypothetical protein
MVVSIDLISRSRITDAQGCHEDRMAVAEVLAARAFALNTRISDGGIQTSLSNVLEIGV